MSRRCRMARRLIWPQTVAVLALIVIVVTHAAGFEMREFQFREDFGTEPLSDCTLQYYYHVPCGTVTWFWAFLDRDYGEILGSFFEIGDVSMYTGTSCDPADCHNLNTVRILDFGGYGDVYPGWNSIQMDVYCCDEDGCPVGPSLWNSGPYDCVVGWNYVDVEPALCLTSCSVAPGPPPLGPRILVTAKCIGTMCFYPAWGFDNVSGNVLRDCEMHDFSSLPALYPRPYNSHYSRVHSGYYGVGFEYCPPIWFCDGRDTVYPECLPYGAVELAWRVYLTCDGPSSAEPSTWGSIKSMYR
jgi:hypothetical protein